MVGSVSQPLFQYFFFPFLIVLIKLPLPFVMKHAIF